MIELNEDDGSIEEWSYCIEDCPVEDFIPVCLDPPPLPRLAKSQTVEDNYNSSWFQVTFIVSC